MLGSGSSVATLPLVDLTDLIRLSNQGNNPVPSNTQAGGNVANTQTIHSTNTTMSTIGALSNNQLFPDLDLTNPHNAFQTFDMFVKVYKITDADAIYCNFIKKLPIKILEIIRDKVDDTLPADERLIRAKDIIIQHINSSGKNSLDLLLSAEKRPDVSFVDFLRTLKNLGRACNSGDAIVKNRFLEKIADKTQYAIAITLLRNESLEVVAEVLDSANKGDTDTTIFAIDRGNYDNKKVKFQDDKLIDTVNKLGEEFEVVKLSVAKLSIQIGELAKRSAETVPIRESSFQGNRNYMRPPFQDNRNYMRPPFHENHNYMRPQYHDTRNYGQPRNFASRNGDNYASKIIQRPPASQTNWRASQQQEDTVRTCFYHSTYGDLARNCSPPCRFFKHNKYPQAKNDLSTL